MPPAVIVGGALAAGAIGGALKAGRTSTQNAAYQQTSQVYLPNPSPEEARLGREFASLGAAQQAAVLDELARQQSRSPYELSPEARADIDASYKSALDRAKLEGNIYAQDLASTRGLLKSDTPIAEQAMSRYGLALGDILSNQARARLELGLAGNQYRTNSILNLSSALPAGSQLQLARLINDRMARQTLYTTGNQEIKSVMSPLQGIGMGMNIAKQFIGGVGGAMAGGAAGGLAGGMLGGGRS